MTDDTRPCEHCGETMHRDGRKPSSFARVRFCGMSCKSKAQAAAKRVNVCAADGCDEPTEGDLCRRHYQRQWREQRKARLREHEAQAVHELRPIKRPPVKCVFCEAIRILANAGASAQETAAAMGKSPSWIKAHLEECTKEKRTA